MSDLVTWLRTQLDAEELAALKAHGGWGPHAWDYDPLHREVRYGQITIYSERQPHGYHTSTAELLARHDPPRVLAEVAGKRQLLDRIVDAANDLDMQVDTMCRVGRRDTIAEPYLGDLLLRLLAAPYADKPGYMEEWAP
jgi:hypothetical protein